MRINKFISDSGVTSRRKAEELISQGRVSVNNNVIQNLSQRINPDKDSVFIDGERIKVKKHVYYLLNKPKGFISTTDDEKNRNTVIDLIKTENKIYPVGRLDYNTTGVLLLTNDGEFSNLLTHPRNKVTKVYEALIDRPLDERDRTELLKGVFIEKRRGKFESVKFPKIVDRKLVEVSCVEGRNHFVKKMFDSLGYTVKKLNRLSFAEIKADIPVGSYRRLAQTEVAELIGKYSNKKKNNTYSKRFSK